MCRLQEVEERGLVFHQLRRPKASEGASAPCAASVTFGVLVYRPQDVRYKLGWPADVQLSIDNEKRLLDEFISRVGNVLLPMLLDAFRHRNRRFAAFPPEIVERYWDDSRMAADRSLSPETLRQCLQPPWNPRPSRSSLVKTATLSLDLRKSTYCMEYARSEGAFGAWLDHLVEMMRAVAHLHGGVFDKFTGDGALVHFLDRECRAIYDGRRAADAAVHCAVDLQRAIEIHMKTLRHILHHDSPFFGAGIAIAVGQAFWSCDHRDNPLVVGKGVVGACRVGDRAPRQSVRLTNLAYMCVSDEVRSCLLDVQRKPLMTNEASDSLELQCWEFSVEEELNLGRGIQTIERLCQEIKKWFDAEKGSKK